MKKKKAKPPRSRFSWTDYGVNDVKHIGTIRGNVPIDIGVKDNEVYIGTRDDLDLVALTQMDVNRLRELLEKAQAHS